MKVLIVSNLFPPDLIGGYELGCCRIAQALAGRGHEVTVATSRAASGAVPEVDDRIRVRRIFPPLRDRLLPGHVPESPALRAELQMKRAGVDVNAMEALREFIAHERPEVIYLFNSVGLGPLGLMETILGAAVPAVFHLMDSLDLVMSVNLHSAGLRARFASLKRGFTAVACSRGCLKNNSRLGRYTASTVIYSGIEESFSPKNLQSEAADDAFRFICTGQIARQKGIPQLLSAFQKVRAASSVPLQLHLVGRTGDGLGGAGERGLEGVVFHGHRPQGEVLELLRQMDAGVYPLPDDEAFGYAPIECLSAGVPAILPRRAGCSEMLPDTYPLFISSRENVDELAAVMGKTVRDRSTRQAAVDEFARIRHRFSFAGHTLPGIEDVLRRARCFQPPPDFRKTRAFAGFMSAVAQREPDLLFHQA